MKCSQIDHRDMEANLNSTIMRKMTNGRPQDQAHSGLGPCPTRPGNAMEQDTSSRTLSTSSVASSAAENSEGHGQSRPSSLARVDSEQKESTDLTQISRPRPPLGPREFSVELVGEIMKVIRQEIIGAYTPNNPSQTPVSEGGGVRPMSADVGDNIPEKSPPPHAAAVRLTLEEGNEGSSSPTAPGSASDTPIASLSSAVSMPLHPLASSMTAKTDCPRPGVRFSDDVTLAQSPISGQATTPTRRPPWAMYRRGSSSSGEPVPEWGVLFDGDGFATARCGQVLRGLATCLAEDFPPREGAVVTPEKLGILYSRFKIEEEVHPFEDIFHIFPRKNIDPGHGPALTTSSNELAAYHDRIGDFFADLDCEYYLVPPSSSREVDFLPRSPSSSSVSSAASPSSPLFPRSGSYSSLANLASRGQNPRRASRHPSGPPRLRPRSARPSVPALTLAGFAQFFTICALAHPDQEAKRLERIVAELALTADAGQGNSSMIPGDIAPPPTGPLAASSPIMQGPSLSSPASSVSLTSGNMQGRGERLPRKFVRSLLPVKPDAKSRKLLAAAVEDFLCDLELSAPSSKPRSLVFSPTTHASSPAARFAEENRRWSFANFPEVTGLELGSGWGSRVPHLPPPPVSLPRSGDGGMGMGMGRGGSGPSALRTLPMSSSVGSLTAYHQQSTAITPRARDDGRVSDPSLSALPPRASHRQPPPRHEHRRYPAEVVIQTQKPMQKGLPPPPPPPPSAPAVASRSRNRATRFELGDGDEDGDGDSDAATTVTTVTTRPARVDRRSTYHGQEPGPDRDRERERDRDRERWWGPHRDPERNRDRGHDYDHDHARERDNKERERQRDPNRRKSYDYGYDRRAAPAPRQFDERRRSSATIVPSVPAPNATSSGLAPPPPIAARTGSNPNAAAAARDGRGSAALVVPQQVDERGPTWSEVIRAQQQQQQSKQPPPPPPPPQQQQQQKVKSVSFYDEKDRAHAH
ncbi:hypothetical protein F5Y14DRAFT_352688 [Nemania sp. NC0429]|nr:hypothetical protein F5Y14DRAFT_352688 [Nemania sp. NC0429]